MISVISALEQLQICFLEMHSQNPPSRQLRDRIFGLLADNISHLRHKGTLPRVSAVHEYAGIDLCWPCGLHMRFYDDIVLPSEFCIEGTFRLTFGSHVVHGLVSELQAADFERFIALAYPL